MQGARGRWPALAAVLRRRGRALPAAGLAFVALLGVTLWMWLTAIEENVRAARERFDFRVDEVEFAVRQRLMAYEQVLRGGVALFAASDSVRRDEWRTYVDALAIDRNFPGIQGIGFALSVRPEERAAHVAAVRAEGFPQYEIRPEGERPEYTAIVYLEPFDWRNQRAFGYDMFSEPVRREAMMRARDSGLPVVSGKVLLVQETDQNVQQGFLMYLPVYRHGAPRDSVEARRAALIGYVYAPFRMNDLMRGILGLQAQPDVDLDIYDGEGAAFESLLYDGHPAPSEERPESAFSRSSTLDLNGRRWTLHFATLPAFEAAGDTQKPRLILIGGTLVSLLFAAFVWSSALNRRRAREIAHANRGLQEEIGARTRLAEQLERAKNAAEAANEAKSAFLASVSHELRTPLTLIMAPVDELLGGARLPAYCREQLVRVQRNALILLNRVNDLLDFSKAEAGKFDVRWDRLELAEIVRPIAEDAAVVAQRKGCALSWRVAPELGTVCLDRSHFEKILLNLVDNALKFTHPGGWIRVEVAVADPRWFRLEVADTGIGIPADKQASLFTRFHQVDGSVTRQYGGTGIGLALVKELAELMGGRVGVCSAAGEGSSFQVHLPRAGNTAALRAKAAAASGGGLVAALRRARLAVSGHGGVSSEAPRRAAFHRQGAPCVLVADDNADMRDYVVGLLAGDYRVVAAEDGEEAWGRLQEEAVDVVVSDLMMPRLDGLGLAARIKADERFAHLPVILVTARGGSEACVSGLDSGADDYLAKPFAPLELRARVRAAVRLGEVQAQLREKAREAGMAAVAIGVLHNLGNALPGVTVAAEIIDERLRRSRAGKLHRLAGLLQTREAAPAPAADADAGEPPLSAYVAALAEHLDRERDELLEEVAALRRCTAHVAGVVAAQQRFTGCGETLRERMAADDLMEMAVQLARSAFEMEDVAIERDYACGAAIEVDRHMILQILLNLFSNACEALHGMPEGSRRIWVRTAATAERVCLAVRDNGCGVDPAHLPCLFNQGFSTRGEGHGYGLHSSANWARELGGTLTAQSEGVGLGAVFTLALPLAGRHDPDPPPARRQPHDQLSKESHHV